MVITLQGGISFQDILQRLSPIQPGINLVWGIMLYLMFFLTIICFGKQKVPVMSTQVLLGAALLAMIIDKVAVGQIGYFPINGASTFVLRVVEFAFPMVGASQSKSPKSRQWGYIASGIGFCYFIARGVTDLGFLQGRL